MDEYQLQTENLTARIRWLMLARVAIITFLLGMAAFSELKGMALFPERSLSFYYVIIVTVYSLSFFYLFLLYLSKNIKINAYIQTMCDAALITYLVYVTGGTLSIYSVFYNLVIVYSVLFMGRGGAIIIASVCSIFYGALLDMEYYGLINPLYVTIGDYPIQAGYVFSRIFTHILSFYMTAFLASFVVEQERKARALLAEKESAFEQLDLLHRSIVESANLGILTINLSGKIKSFNKAAQEITDYAFADVEGKSILEILPIYGDMPAKRDAFQTPAENRFEVVFKTKKDRKVILGCSVSPLKNNKDERIGDILIFQDLTSIKKMEEIYEKSRRMALIGEMAARLAHEIRNPLASISGSIQVLSRSLYLPHSDERLMRIILRGKEQLESFMKDFLLLARPTPGSPEMIDSREIMEEALDALQYGQDWHEGIEIRKSLEENIFIYANRSEIRQVIWNLLLNALQAMPAEGALTVKTKKNSFDGFPDGLEILVSDTGCGIEEKDLEKVFEPFYTTKEQGTGLGLAIVSRVVEAIKGKIKISSEIGRGTSFLLYLPAQADNRDFLEMGNG
ncbi:MAG TPA: ATP-binding protein [Syntrophales bacterium]|nr:ATP-binding protein [Syntrophales bacterium]